MTSGATDNDSIELAVLKNPQIDTEIVSVALLESMALCNRIQQVDHDPVPRAFCSPQKGNAVSFQATYANSEMTL